MYFLRNWGTCTDSKSTYSQTFEIIIWPYFLRKCNFWSNLISFDKGSLFRDPIMAQGMSPVSGRVRNRGRGLLEVTRGCSRKGRIGRSQNSLFSASHFSSRPLIEVIAHFSASCIHDCCTRRLSKWPLLDPGFWVGWSPRLASDLERSLIEVAKFFGLVPDLY